MRAHPCLYPLFSWAAPGGYKGQLRGLTVPRVAAQPGPVIESTLRSFRALTDPAALGVQPARVQLLTLDQAMSGQQFAQRYPSSVPAEEVYIINGITAGTALPRGMVLKRVVGGVHLR